MGEAKLSEVTRAAARLGSVEEAVVVSTCNRVEFYAATTEPVQAFESLSGYLRETTGREPGGEFYRYGAPQSVRHLFRMVCGLDSMVLGETEVFGQVKRAYAFASTAGGTARHLNKLFQRAFNVGKHVRSKTNITRGAVSVGSVAVELAEKIFGSLNQCRVLIIGAGETSEQTARALLSRGAQSIFVSNRSHDRAMALAGAMGGRAIRFEDWGTEFAQIDILISSTSAPHFLLTKETLDPIMRRRRDRPLFVIDLAVPRDVDPAINAMDGVYLYDIDSLKAIARESLAVREQEVGQCESLIEHYVMEFTEWLGTATPPPQTPPDVLRTAGPYQVAES